MSVQIIQDVNGKPTGVFIPIEDWVSMKSNYPDIEKSVIEIELWEKEIIDERLKAINESPGRLIRR